jgi:glycosyltransferase involved in cell wall biosynthesis
MIIVDDGSTDKNTIEYLRSLDNEKIRVYYQANQGVSVARNMGASLSLGDYLLFLDADDKINTDYLLFAAKQLEKDVELDYIYCDLIEFEGGSNIRVFGDLNLSDALLHCLTHTSGIISRKLWNKSGGYDKDFINGWEDWDFLIRLITLGINFYKIPKPFLQYRIRHDSRDTKANEKFAKELEQKIFCKNLDSYLAMYDMPLTILRDYEQQKRINEDLVKHIKAIYNTKSYRLGAFLLCPVKFIVRKIKARK